MHDLEEMVASQRDVIQGFSDEMFKKDKTIEEFLSYGSYPFQEKYVALQKRYCRLQARERRQQYSPYLTDKQVRAIFRNSNRGVEWDDELIREGLILKMKCGTKGYMSFVQKYPILPLSGLSSYQ